MVELERCRGRQYRLEMAAEPEAGRDAQRRAQRLPAAQRVVEDQVVEAVRAALTRAVQPVDLAVAGVLTQGEIVVERVAGCRVRAAVKCGLGVEGDEAVGIRDPYCIADPGGELDCARAGFAIDLQAGQQADCEVHRLLTG